MNELKLIHAADLHLDAPFDSLPPEQAVLRRAQRRELVFTLVRTARDKGAQALLLSGDIFDGPEVSPETARDFCRAMNEAEMPVIAVTGNHDPYSPESVWARLQLPDNFYLFGKNEFSSLELPSLGVRFWGAGFEESFCPPLLRDFAPPERREGLFEVMVLHGDTSSAASDYCPVTRRELEHSGMDYVALGHIHSRSLPERAGQVCWAYPGCLEGGGYDETGEKGALLVTLTNTGAKCDFIPLEGVRYEIIRVDVSHKEDCLSAVNEAISHLSHRDFCRIILTGQIDSAPPDLSALRRALDGRLAQIQLRDETAQKRDVWAAAGENTLEGVFLTKLKNLLEKAASPEEKQMIELAAQYGTAAMEKGGSLL